MYLLESDLAVCRFLCFRFGKNLSGGDIRSISILQLEIINVLISCDVINCNFCKVYVLSVSFIQDSNVFFLLFI